MGYPKGVPRDGRHSECNCYCPFWVGTYSTTRAGAHSHCNHHKVNESVVEGLECQVDIERWLKERDTPMLKSPKSK